LKNGYAWHYLKYDTIPAWKALENLAKIYKKGLWVYTNPIAAWDYRKSRKKKKR
jgi:endonuclease YncB( thermonuclease family)